jgi:hypothetical protein
VSVAYNFQIANNKIKMLKEYKSVTQRFLSGNAVLAALMSGIKYEVIPKNDDCTKESNMRTSYFETKSVIEIQRHYRNQYGNIQLQIMLSDVD